MYTTPEIRSTVRINTNKLKVHRYGHGECGDDVAGKKQPEDNAR
jgi:hypothetical protein